LGGVKTGKNEKKNPRVTGFRIGMVDLAPTPYPTVASQDRPMRRCIYCGGSCSF